MAFKMSPIPQYIVDDLDPLLSTRITVERKDTPFKCPLTVDILLEPVSTNDGVLYESYFRVFSAVGDPLFGEIWDSLSKRITLSDQALGEWDASAKSSGYDYFVLKINLSPEEAHDAVVYFFGRSGLSGVSFYERPMDYAPLKVRSDERPVRFAWEVEATAP